MATTSARALRLLSLLQSRREWPGPVLAGRLGVSTRTLRRDVESLRELGYPVRTAMGPEGGYRLAPGSSLPPMLFDDEQAVAVALALQTVPVTVSGVDEGAARALATLTQVMPARLRAEVDSVRLTAVRNYWDFAGPPIDPDVLRAVGSAVHRAQVLRFDHLRADGTCPGPREPGFMPPRQVEPHHLVLWAGRWYLLAYDLSLPPGGEWAVYRVDRIRAAAATGRCFARRPLPDPDVGHYVMTRHDRGDTPAPWQCLGTVVMELPADVVARWAPGGSVVERLGPQRTRFTVGAWSWVGVAGILATFGAAFTVEGPVELRDACREIGRRLDRA
ncbi:WYL domain-containing protein [Kineosporia sp. J2-2]|uniref:WYL domain-containing protein n=1 Tax=Kineosporia corallincola TaxID=2835133 RepID=A0ABS5TP40_9ACTN|nr:WYL domain-containing protein [Kineosporia corallincola]MBT0772857.1 WYL domain-containing protein [Kineosporia corallincola]